MLPKRDLICYERIFCDWSKRLKPNETSSLSDSGLRLIAENDFWRFEGLPDVGGLSSKGFRGRISAFSGRQSVERRRATALSGRDEGEHPLDVPDHGDEAPFAARAREAAQGN